MPTSATLAPHGRRAASKTPSAGYAETSPEKPTSTPCLPKPSTPSSKTTTTHPENASASFLKPKPSDRCTSNVNPHPDQVRGVEGGYRPLASCNAAPFACLGQPRRRHPRDRTSAE